MRGLYEGVPESLSGTVSISIGGKIPRHNFNIACWHEKYENTIQALATWAMASCLRMEKTNSGFP